MRNQKHQLGIKAKDKITGFEGMITGISRYITGCDQYIVQPEAKDGDFKEGRWFDEGRLQEVSDEQVITEDSVKSRKFGSCGSAPVK